MSDSTVPSLGRPLDSTTTPVAVHGDIRIEKIRQLSALQDNWDGYCAARIAPDALKVLEGVQVIPCADGGVQIDIYAAGWETEIVFGPDGRPKSVIFEESTRDCDPGSAHPPGVPGAVPAAGGPSAS